MERWRRCWFITGLIVLAASLAGAAAQAFFTSQESIEMEIVRLIDESQSSIDMAIFRFASRPLAQAIGRARSRGVRIRIILDGHHEEHARTRDLGNSFAPGEVRRLDGKRGERQGIMHHKFALFDRARVITGSFNWTPSAEHVNYENALLIDDAKTATSYAREFETLWNRARPVAPGESTETPAFRDNPGHRKKSSFSRNARRIRLLIQKRRTKRL